jgi:RimJ/RimL family protein N-acetyltransferase
LGPVIGGGAMLFLGRSGPGLAAALMSCITMLFAYHYLTESHDAAAAKAAGKVVRKSSEAVRRVVSHGAEPASRLIWIYAITMGSFQAMSTTLALFLGWRFGVTASNIWLFFSYMGTISVAQLTSPERLSRLYDDTLDYRQHAAFIAELDNEIIGVAHAFRLNDAGTFEVSFSRRSDLRGQGIGRHLMQMLIDWGATRAMGAQEFYATTYRTENPRMRALFDRFGFVAKADPDDPRVVIYTASVAELVRAGERVMAPRPAAAVTPPSPPATVPALQ